MTENQTELEIIKQYFQALTDDERVSFILKITEGYCVNCGGKRKWICYCENEE